MTSTTAPAPGWYPDATAPHLLRWWDGTTWSPETTPAPVAVASPAAPAPYAYLPATGGAYRTAPAGVGASPADPIHWLLPTGRSGWSIAAGYVALFAFLLWPLGPVAVGLGIAGLRDSARTGTHGRGRAWFGIVVGALATLACLLFAVSWLA